MKIHRLFEIVHLLLNRKTLTAKELSQHFEVSLRTIYRDVELLSVTGIPIYMTKGKNGGISLLDDFVLNKAVLTNSEKEDILSALSAIASVNFKQPNTTLQKISSIFGNADTDWIEVDFSNWANHEEEPLLFDTLKTTILGKQNVQFIYSSKNGSMLRAVEPLKLCFRGQSWYLYAYCSLREDYRFFKLRRIKKLELLTEHFDRSTPPQIIDKDTFFPDQFVTIKLKISVEMAYRVYDEFSQYEMLPDGSFLAELTIPEGVWIYQYLATFGKHCEIIEPLRIRLQIKDELQKTLNQYL